VGGRGKALLNEKMEVDFVIGNSRKGADIDASTLGGEGRGEMEKLAFVRR